MINYEDDQPAQELQQHRSFLQDQRVIAAVAHVFASLPDDFPLILLSKATKIHPEFPHSMSRFDALYVSHHPVEAATGVRKWKKMQADLEKILGDKKQANAANSQISNAFTRVYPTKKTKEALLSAQSMEEIRSAERQIGGKTQLKRVFNGEATANFLYRISRGPTRR